MIKVPASPTVSYINNVPEIVVRVGDQKDYVVHVKGPYWFLWILDMLGISFDIVSVNV